MVDAAVLFACVMVGPGWWMPANASLHGVALDRQLRVNLSVFLGLCVLAQVLLLVGVVLKRRVQPDLPQPLAHRRWRLELLPLGVLAVLFFSLAVWSERLWAAQRYTGGDPAALQVEAVGMQFAWYFRYPGEDAAFGQTQAERIDAGVGNPLGIDPADERGRDDFVRSQLVLPAGREVDVRLRALDVIHGFAVPALRVKQNALPGQTIHIHFTPTVPGDYSVLCTQVCGLGHARMQAVVRVLPAAEFEQWMRAAEGRVAQSRATGQATVQSEVGVSKQVAVQSGAAAKGGNATQGAAAVQSRDVGVRP